MNTPWKWKTCRSLKQNKKFMKFQADSLLGTYMAAIPATIFQLALFLGHI